MKLASHLTDYIEMKIGTGKYQLWKYEGIEGKAKLIKSFQTEELFGSPTCHPDKGKYYIERADCYADFHFYYSADKGIVLRIFESVTVIDDMLSDELYHSLYAVLLEEELNKKTIEQNVVIDSMQSISSSLDLDQVLKKIIRYALHVIPSADAGYLMLYDPKEERLVPKTAVGFTDHIYQFKTKIGESITGKTFEDGKGRVYNSHEELIAAMHDNNVKPANIDTIFRAINNSVEGAICVPITVDDNRIGVMITHQWELKKKLGEEDIQLLEMFARQAAIAIQNAQFHTETEKRLEQITALSAQLKEKNDQLQKRQEVHHTLTMLSLENKGIHKVFEGMQKMIDQKLLFFNGLENIIYSPLEEEFPAFSVFEVRMMCLNRRKAFYVHLLEGNYYFYPIYNGQIFLGCLIASIDKQLSEFDQITLEQGSTVLALELVNRQTSTKIYHRRVYEQFRELLHSDEEQLIEYGKELNLNIHGDWAVGVLEILKDKNDFRYLDIYVHQLASRLKKEFGDKVKLVYGLYNKINLLFSLSSAEEIYEVKTKLNQIRVQEKSRDTAVFRGGVSTVYKGLQNINKCYDEANKTISYLTSRNSLEVILYEDIGLNRLFLNQPAEDIDQFIQEVLAPLCTESGRKKELEKTLITYMEESRSPSKTAKNLHIHINTLYQRLQTIEELLHIDLNNSHDALKIQLACHLKKSRLTLQES